MNPTAIPLEERIIFALDLADPGEARALVDRLSGRIRFFKVGLQLFFAGGWPMVDYIVGKDNAFFQWNRGWVHARIISSLSMRSAKSKTN
jgi:hypothetical protein